MASDGVLVLLDLSGAFDTTVHNILYSIEGTALQWFGSFVFYRFTFMHVNGEFC